MSENESEVDESIVKYDILTRIGYGRFCKVSKAKHLKNGKLYAAKHLSDNIPELKGTSPKTMKKTKWAVVANEFNILSRLNHDNIIKVIEMYENQDQVYLIMEFAKGGDLFEMIKLMYKLKEDHAADSIRQVLLGTQYLHINGFVHRDIKPENIFIDYNGKSTRFMLGDFDVACAMNSQMNKNCGTLQYWAPERIVSKYKKTLYGPQIDTWSIGVTAYVILCGYAPFRPSYKDNKAIERKITTGKITFMQEDWAMVSCSAKEFIRQLLKVKVSERITISNALNHAWITHFCNRDGLKSSCSYNKSFVTTKTEDFSKMKTNDNNSMEREIQSNSSASEETYKSGKKISHGCRFM